jgi:hypothetical protein
MQTVYADGQAEKQPCRQVDKQAEWQADDISLLNLVRT